MGKNEKIENFVFGEPENREYGSRSESMETNDIDGGKWTKERERAEKDYSI